MKKILVFMAMAAMVLTVSCKKENNNNNNNQGGNGGTEETGLAIKIDGKFEDWAALKPEVVSVAKNNPNSPWDAVSEIRCCADADFVYYYIKYNNTALKEMMDNAEETLPIRLNINTDGEFESGYKSYSLDGYDFIVEGELVAGKQWAEFSGTLHQRLDGWQELLSSASGLVTGKGNGNEYEILFSRELFNNAVPAGQKMGDEFYTGIRLYYKTYNETKEKWEWTELSNLPNASAEEGDGNGWGHLMKVTTVK